MDDQSWKVLIDRIKRGKVTPFLGAAASYPTLPTGTQLAVDWARRFDLEFGERDENKDDLTEIAQRLSVARGPMCPKIEVSQDLDGIGPPDFTQPNDPHTVLASLDLPIYITTNYDDFMFQALRATGKDPIREFCRWNADIRDNGHESVFDRAGFEPTPANPVVFHLHGIREVPESIVISEDDYLSFIVDISWHRRLLLPPRIQQALTGSSLMFIGYSLKDWTFKVIFRALVLAMEAELRRESVSVQLPAKDRKERSFLAQSLHEKSIEVYWGDLRDFVAEIRERYDATPAVSAST